MTHYYKTFSLEDENIKGRRRLITLCVTPNYGISKDKLGVGYAVCMPQDKFDQDKAKLISRNRSMSRRGKLNSLKYDVESLPKRYRTNKKVLHGIVDEWAKRIKMNPSIIKGIR